MLNPKKSVNKPFLENLSMCRKHIQNFLAQNFDFFKRIFSGNIKFEANKETIIILVGSEGACFSGKFFKIYVLQWAF